MNDFKLSQKTFCRVKQNVDLIKDFIYNDNTKISEEDVSAASGVLLAFAEHALKYVEVVE